MGIPKQQKSYPPQQLDQHRPETAGSISSATAIDQMFDSEDIDIDEYLIGRRRSATHPQTLWAQTPELTKCVPKAVYSGSPYAAPVLGTFLVHCKAEAEMLWPATRSTIGKHHTQGKSVTRSAAH